MIKIKTVITSIQFGLICPLGATWELSGPILGQFAELGANYADLRPPWDNRNMIWSVSEHHFVLKISRPPNIAQKWLNTKIVLHTHHHHHKELLDQQYLNCYLPNFDETLKVGSWEDLKQIPTVRLTFVQAIFVLATFVQVKNISAVTDPIFTKL